MHRLKARASRERPGSETREVRDVETQLVVLLQRDMRGRGDDTLAEGSLLRVTCARPSPSAPLLQNTHHSRARSCGATLNGGYSQIAPAPMLTVSSGRSRATSVTLKPRSSSRNAHVSPVTPPPTTTARASLSARAVAACARLATRRSTLGLAASCSSREASAAGITASSGRMTWTSEEGAACECHFTRMSARQAPRPAGAGCPAPARTRAAGRAPRRGRTSMTGAR